MILRGTKYARKKIIVFALYGERKKKMKKKDVQVSSLNVDGEKLCKM